METTYPKKIKAGDTVRIIAPARSLSIISMEARELANKRLSDLGLKVTFGRHIEECDNFASSSIESRIEDLHEAFRDPEVKLILTVIGGFNSNQLLRYLDWDLIRKNPKAFCGYSDITILNNAILAKTGLASYYGPHYSSFGQKLYFDYTNENFKKCLFSEEPYEVEASPEWSDDLWYKDQNDRTLIPNDGMIVIQEGDAEGMAIGGNLCTLNLLQGTEYFPSLGNSILFVEDDNLTGSCADVEFDRDLQAVIHQEGFEGVKGIVIGRFQKASQMTTEKIAEIIKSKKELAGLPVIANVDFGHTDPKITFPIGGRVSLSTREGKAQLKILKH